MSHHFWEHEGGPHGHKASTFSGHKEQEEEEHKKRKADKRGIVHICGSVYTGKPCSEKTFLVTQKQTSVSLFLSVNTSFDAKSLSLSSRCSTVFLSKAVDRY